MKKNDRVTLLIIKDGHILLLFRFRKGREYYVFPGGGVDDNETIEQAAVREAKEETNLDVGNLKELFVVENEGRPEHCILVGNFNGKLNVGGPEAERQAPDNVYRLEWIAFDCVNALTLLPEGIKQKVCKEVLFNN